MGKGTGGVVDVVLGRRYTRNPESPPLEGQSQIFFFFFGLTCKIFVKYFADSVPVIYLKFL